MSRFQTNNESASDNVGSTTHKSDPQAASPHSHRLHTISEEERLDETSATRHEPIALTNTFVSAEDEANTNMQIVSTGKEVDSDYIKSDASMKIHRKVAEIAANSFHRASEESLVLSSAMLADIALVNIGELTIGKFLGQGSFSNVQ